MARRLAVLTTGRQDYGILRSILLALRDDRRFDLRVLAGGMHLRERFGRTIDHVRADGLSPVELDFLSEPPDPAADAAHAAQLVAEHVKRERPDAMVVLGDRHEVLGCAMAAVIERIPIAHLHGGEESEGVIDNAVRHALTKLSNLHLVSHDRHARRVRQMGETAESIVVVGAAGLDNLYRSDLPGRDELSAALGLPLKDPVVIVTMHPVTLGGDAVREVSSVGEAMANVDATFVITQPNADAGGAAIRDYWTGWAGGRRNVAVVDALGEARYWGLLRLAAAVLGNSSSGIIEAPEAGVPVVNVGDRQRGRLRGRGVIDVAPDASAVGQAVRDAIGPGARKRIVAMPRTYPEGPAAPRVIEALSRWAPVSTRKAFQDMP